MDGISDSPFNSDLGIIGDRIEVLGKLDPDSAKVVIDATDKIVAPGFIDIHTQLFLHPSALCFPSAPRTNAQQDPYEFVCDLLISEGGDLSIIGFGMGEENTSSILKHPLVILGSDGVALAPYGKLSEGILSKCSYANIVIFDPETVIDLATHTEPAKYSKVIDTVIINGTIVIDGGEHTDKLP